MHGSMSSRNAKQPQHVVLTNEVPKTASGPVKLDAVASLPHTLGCTTMARHLSRLFDQAPLVLNISFPTCFHE
jgi:hypothetical protein